MRKSKGAAAAPCAASQSVRVEAVACSALMPCSSCAFHTRKYSATAACMVHLYVKVAMLYVGRLHRGHTRPKQVGRCLID